MARSRARYLAPIALAATIAGTYLVVHSGLNSHHSAVQSQQDGPRSGHRRRQARARFYTVRPGDNLTGIAAKTGVPVGTIESLNPNLDPNSLQAAQRLRLRR
jgi:LysM repeat protein